MKGQLSLSLFFFVMTTWDQLIKPITDMGNDLIGNPAVIGALIFVIITFLAIVLLIPFEAVIVIWVPLSVFLMLFIPALRIVLGLTLGILIGLGLLKWFRR